MQECHFVVDPAAQLIGWRAIGRGWWRSPPLDTVEAERRPAAERNEDEVRGRIRET